MRAVRGLAVAAAVTAVAACVVQEQGDLRCPASPAKVGQPSAPSAAPPVAAQAGAKVPDPQEVMIISARKDLWPRGIVTRGLQI
jgi:hypothetical protein